MSTSHTISDFLDLSAALTGFDRIELEGTGLTDAFYDEVNRIVGGRIFGRLLLRWHDLSEEAGTDEKKLAALVKKRILKSDLLGDIAKNIISLWYVGNWFQMPGSWRDKYGATAGDLTHVVSAAAFREGLVWRAIDAHPPTAKSPGFGTWSFPPKGAEALDANDVAYFAARGIKKSVRKSSRSKSQGNKSKTAKRASGRK